MLSAIVNVLATVATEAGNYLPPLITIGLIVLLVLREVLSGLKNQRLEQVRRIASLSIVPLLVIFVATVAIRVFELIVVQ
jgi:hypothetical protein